MNSETIVQRVQATATRRLGEGVETVEIRSSARRSTADLREVDIRVRGGRVVRLLVKLSPPVAPPSRPAEVYDARREAAVYRLLLSRRDLGAPGLWDAWTSEGEVALLLERVEGVTLAETHRRETWLDAARALARLHERATGLGRRHARAAHLLRVDGQTHRLWLRRAAEIVRDPRMDRIARAHPEIVRRIGRLPRVLLHGEPYPANIMVDGGEVRLIDWEAAALGPDLMDLAALTSGTWQDAALRREVALAYRDASPAWRGEATKPFLAALDACGVQVAIGWLGWSSTWIPPRDHRHDWLSAASEALERLGL